MTRARRVGALIAVGCLLTACGSDDVGESPPTPSTSEAPEPTTSAETPAPTPVPTPPELPPEATAATASGASAFARWWWGELIPYTYSTGDVDPLVALAGPECRLCSGLADEVTRKTTDGARFEGGDIEVGSSESGGLEGNGVAVVTTFVTQKEGRLVTDREVVIEEFGAEPELRSDLYLYREGEEWMVKDVTTGDPFSSPEP